MEDKYVPPAEVVRLSGGVVTTANLKMLRYRKRGPRFYKPTPRTVLYKMSDVLAWLESSARETREEPIREAS